MTRKEAQLESFRHVLNIANGGSSDGLSLMLDEIFDSFEKQTCETCRWYRDIDKSFKVCKLFDLAHGKDFGCNKYEPKDK